MQPITRLELSRFARRYVSAGARLISPANARRIDRLGDDRPLRNLRARQPADLPDRDALDATSASGRETDDAIEAALDDALGLLDPTGAVEDDALGETEWEA